MFSILGYSLHVEGNMFKVKFTTLIKLHLFSQQRQDYDMKAMLCYIFI